MQLHVALIFLIMQYIYVEVPFNITVVACSSIFLIHQPLPEKLCTLNPPRLCHADYWIVVMPKEMQALQPAVCQCPGLSSGVAPYCAPDMISTISRVISEGNTQVHVPCPWPCQTFSLRTITMNMKSSTTNEAREVGTSIYSVKTVNTKFRIIILVFLYQYWHKLKQENAVFSVPKQGTEGTTNMIYSNSNKLLCLILP